MPAVTIGLDCPATDFRFDDAVRPPSASRTTCRPAATAATHGGDMSKDKGRLSDLNKKKKVKFRHILQDWEIWLSDPDHKGNDVNVHLKNIYLDDLEKNEVHVYERLREKFKNLLVDPSQLFLQYKLSSEEFPISIELTQQEQVLAAFKKFAALKQNEYASFGPVFVLFCHGPVWTTSPAKVGITVTALKGRPAMTRYLTDKYSQGKISLGILDEMMTLTLGGLQRGVYGVMPNAEREHHGYLLEKTRCKERTPEELYKAGQLTMQAYEELRYPEAKLEGEKREATYPEPEESHRCVVCQHMTATVSCMECPNKVCHECVRRECLEKGNSFLHFHHQHCLKFGRPFRKSLPLAEDLRRRRRPSWWQGGKNLFPGTKTRSNGNRTIS